MNQTPIQNQQIQHVQLSFPVDTVNLILKGVSMLPYHEAIAIVQSIQQQAVPQIQEEEKKVGKAKK